jgi:hypothetical protein
VPLRDIPARFRFIFSIHTSYLASDLRMHALRYSLRSPTISVKVRFGWRSAADETEIPPPR